MATTPSEDQNSNEAVFADRELLQSNDKTPRFTLKGNFVAKCVNVYDGDTAQFTFRLARSFSVVRFTCRFEGYNCAEIRGKTEEERTRAKEVAAILREKILNKIVDLKVGDFDPRGRPLVTVCLNGININQWMLDNGYGCAYNGLGEKKWK